MQGSKQFKGLQLHAKQFTDAAVCDGKKVVVVGSGKTALDSSSEVAMCQTAASVTWLFRQVRRKTSRSMECHSQAILNKLAEDEMTKQTARHTCLAVHGKKRSFRRI